MYPYNSKYNEELMKDLKDLQKTDIQDTEIQKINDINPNFDGKNPYYPTLPEYPWQKPDYKEPSQFYPDKKPQYPDFMPNYPDKKPYPPEPDSYYPDKRPFENNDAMPTSPPPRAIPEKSPSLYAVDPGAIRGCLYNYTYIWLRNGSSFWMFPIYVGRNSVAGYRYTRNRWFYMGLDLESIESFSCGGRY